MAYMALYRQWRPQNFEALVGQQAVKKTLTNALNSGRIAHAYLFTGPRGTGKTSTARILAKALNCEQGPTSQPCGKCMNCERITQGTSMDVFEIDAASNRGIEEIKALREQLAFTPVDGRYKIYIIDEVHMLTTEAFNALLKTLEEPPAHVIFILATTDPHKIPATIHSRCQRFDFHRVTIDEIAAHLQMVAQNSGIQAEEEALRLIAIQSEGGMRDALSLLDQCGVMNQRVDVGTVREVLGIVGREALRKLVLDVGKKDISASLEQLRVLLEQGKDVKQILVEVAEYFRAVMLFKAAPGYSEIYLTDTAEALTEAAKLYGQERLMAAEERIHSALQELKGTMRPRITVELCLLDLCRQEGSTLAALAARIEELERQLAQGVVCAASTQYRDFTRAVAPTENTTGNAPVKELSDKPVPNMECDTKEAPKTVKPIVKSQAETQKPAEDNGVAIVQNINAPGLDDTGDVPAGEEYWKQALELLKNEKKNAMVSCAKPGRVVAYSNHILQVAFKSEFQCDRMNKDDYRRAFEDVLLRLARVEIHLQCVAEGKLDVSTPKNKQSPILKNNSQQAVQAVSSIKPSVAVASATVMAELPENLQKAMQTLGGSVQKL